MRVLPTAAILGYWLVVLGHVASDRQELQCPACCRHCTLIPKALVLKASKQCQMQDAWATKQLGSDGRSACTCIPYPERKNHSAPHVTCSSVRCVQRSHQSLPTEQPSQLVTIVAVKHRRTEQKFLNNALCFLVKQTFNASWHTKALEPLRAVAIVLQRLIVSHGTAKRTLLCFIDLFTRPHTPRILYHSSSPDARFLFVSTVLGHHHFQ